MCRYLQLPCFGIHSCLWLNLVPFQDVKDCLFPGSGHLMCQLVPGHSLFQAAVLLLIQGWLKKRDRYRILSFVDFTEANRGVGEGCMGLPLTGLLDVSWVILTSSQKSCRIDVSPHSPDWLNHSFTYILKHLLGGRRSVGDIAVNNQNTVSVLMGFPV